MVYPHFYLGIKILTVLWLTTCTVFELCTSKQDYLDLSLSSSKARLLTSWITNVLIKWLSSDGTYCPSVCLQYPAAADGDVCRRSTAPPQRKSLAPTAILRSTQAAPTCVLITSPHTAAPDRAPPRARPPPRWPVRVEGWSNTAWRSKRSTSRTGQHTARR